MLNERMQHTVRDGMGRSDFACDLGDIHAPKNFGVSGLLQESPLNRDVVFF
ncbi:hypothetical protein [Allochromatium tepidum]|uniref:hypothetical protein n=1 Tax=Allochromatium tepidum TaxID=553982 RepID=UPI001BD00657|nr:hypothetical protein [Allochromatium tepidum]